MPFRVLHLDEAGWLQRETARCISKRRITIRLPRAMRRASVRYLGKRASVRRSQGRLTARIDLRGAPARTVTVPVRGRSRTGRTLQQTRRFKTCRGRTA